MPRVLVGRPGLSPVMVGRGPQLARLKNLACSGGDPRVALVSGEAGSGKTRLIQELLTGIDPSTKVFTAHAEEGAMGRPFNLLVEAVGPDVRRWEAIPQELSAWEDALGTLLGPAAPVLRAEERTYASDELLRAAAELVRYLAAGCPAVLVFEDLHWADADSLSLFQRLSVTSGLDLLLVGTFRPEDLDRRHLTDLLSAVERYKQVEHVNIARLGIRQVGTLIGAIRSREVSFATAAALHNRTGGNPFFLEELLVSAGDVPVHDLADYPLPRTLTEAVLRHLDGLDTEERRAVDAASILGERIPFDLLTAVTGLGEDRLLDALRVLVDRGLLVEETEDVFSFRHALTREAVAGRLLGRERRRLHEKALAVLEEAGSDDWAALAHHAHAAGRLDEMVAAARKGASSYLRSGATYQALRLAELALHEGESDDELLELATLASWSVGLLATAVERAEQWRAEALEREDDQSLARSLRFLARLRWETDNPEAHRRVVDEALEVAKRLPPGVHRAWIANLAAEAAMLEGDTASAVRWADEAIEAAGEKPPGRLLAPILVNRGTALLDSVGDEERGASLVEEGLRIAIEVEDHMTTLRALNNMAHYAMPKWEPSRTRALLDQMREVIGRTGRQDWWDNWIELRAVFLAHVEGDLVSARTLLRMETPVRGRRWLALADGELAFEAGEFDEAERLLTKAVDEPRPPPSLVWDRGYGYGLSARVASQRRDAPAAADLIRKLASILALVASPKRPNLSDAWNGALTAACRSGLSIDQIQELEDLLVEPFGPLGHQGDPGWPDHYLGAKSELAGNVQDAIEHYTSATTTTGWRRSVPAQADALMGLARVRLLAGDMAKARESAIAAAKLLELFPSWRRDEALALVRRLDGTGTPASEGELTAREREVVALVAQGRTNGEIGKLLFISTKTASVHVSSILRKLALSNRSEVAAWAVRNGFTEIGSGTSSN